MKKDEIEGFNAGLKEAQWQITKSMRALKIFFDRPEVVKLLQFIHDQIEKEKK